jgi:hypothetical protein
VAKRPTLTTDSGMPVSDNQNSITAGPRGPVLMQDFVLFEKLAHQNRERIPERGQRRQARDRPALSPRRARRGRRGLARRDDASAASNVICAAFRSFNSHNIARGRHLVGCNSDWEQTHHHANYIQYSRIRPFGRTAVLMNHHLEMACLRHADLVEHA